MKEEKASRYRYFGIDKGKPDKSKVFALTWNEKGVKKSMPVNDPLLLRLIKEGKIANVKKTK